MPRTRRAGCRPWEQRRVSRYRSPVRGRPTAVMSSRPGPLAMPFCYDVGITRSCRASGAAPHASGTPLEGRLTGTWPSRPRKTCRPSLARASGVQDLPDAPADALEVHDPSRGAPASSGPRGCRAGQVQAASRAGPATSRSGRSSPAAFVRGPSSPWWRRPASASAAPGCSSSCSAGVEVRAELDAQFLRRLGRACRGLVDEPEDLFGGSALRHRSGRGRRRSRRRRRQGPRSAGRRCRRRWPSRRRSLSSSSMSWVDAPMTGEVVGGVVQARGELRAELLVEVAERRPPGGRSPSGESPRKSNAVSTSARPATSPPTAATPFLPNPPSCLSALPISLVSFFASPTMETRMTLVASAIGDLPRVHEVHEVRARRAGLSPSRCRRGAVR